MTTAMKLRDQWAKGIPALGAFAAFPSPSAAEYLCVPGIDYVCIDQQHGTIDYTDTIGMLRAIEARGKIGITRVSANQDWLIGRALDAGAQGVIIPMVNTGAEARAAVNACRFAPNGTRSFAPVRASMVMGNGHPSVIGDQVLCFVMVETREALGNVEEIAGTPGLDGIYIGPGDLALSLGLPPGLEHDEPEHVAALARILAVCNSSGIFAGIQCGNGTAARHYADQGYKLVTVASDWALMARALAREMADALPAKT